MSRALFIAKLKEGLTGLPQPEIDEITSDYEHHFAEAAAGGQSEEDIVARLGDPARLARELRGDAQQGAQAEPQPPPATMASAAPRRRLGGLLALVVAIGVAAAVFYIAWHSPGRNASAPVTGAAPALPPQRAMAAPATGARIVISGGQVLDLGTIAQERLEVVIDGGGHATAKGRVKELTVHIDGSGRADFGDLQANTVHVELSGTGDAEVSGTKMADITISGTGTVRLKVKPKLLKQSIAGSGQVLLPT